MEAAAPRRLSLKSAAAEASRRRRVAQARPSLQDARAHAVGDTWRRGKSFWQLRFLSPAAAGHTVDGTLPRYFAVRSLLARADRRVDATVASVAGETLNPAAAAERAADVCGEWASYADGALTIHEYVRSHPHTLQGEQLQAVIGLGPLPGHEGEVCEREAGRDSECQTIWPRSSPAPAARRARWRRSTRCRRQRHALPRQPRAAFERARRTTGC